jgi:hypothetical protein
VEAGSGDLATYTAYAEVSIAGSGNSAPTLTVNDPDGSGDTVTVGDNYNINYDLADTDDTVTVAFYYDDDDTGLNGTAISGACATAAEGTGVTCTWDTSGMTPGSYYVYGVTNDGTNPDVTDYSPGQITINAVSGINLDQTHFRWRNDDGSEGTTTTITLEGSNVSTDNGLLNDHLDAPFWSHTVTNGSNTILIVAVAIDSPGGSDVINSMTYNGDALTKLYKNEDAVDVDTEVWFLRNPDVGTYDIVMNTAGGVEEYAAAAMNFTGVDVTTSTSWRNDPYGTADGDNDTPAISGVTSASHLRRDQRRRRACGGCSRCGYRSRDQRCRPDGSCN